VRKEAVVAKTSGPRALLDRAKHVAEEAVKRAEPVAKRVGEAARKAPVPKQAKDAAGRVAKRVEPVTKKAGAVLGDALERARRLPAGLPGRRAKSAGAKTKAGSKKSTATRKRT
jgi:hypothetical protein